MDKVYLFVDRWHQEKLGQIDAYMSESPLVHDLPLLDRWVHKVTTEEKEELRIEELSSCLLYYDTEFERINFLLLAVDSFDRCLDATVFEDNFSCHSVEEGVLSRHSWFLSLIICIEFLGCK